MKNSIAVATLLVVISFSSCYYDNLEELHVADNPCTVPDTSSYANHIAPIMTSSCGTSNSGCHQAPDNNNGKVGLANYSDVHDAISAGLMDAINHTSGSPMPKGGGKLSDCNIETIQKWVDAGGPNN